LVYIYQNHQNENKPVSRYMPSLYFELNSIIAEYIKNFKHYFLIHATIYQEEDKIDVDGTNRFFKSII
jgi:hypothetical protein